MLVLIFILTGSFTKNLKILKLCIFSNIYDEVESKNNNLLFDRFLCVFMMNIIKLLIILDKDVYLAFNLKFYRVAFYLKKYHFDQLEKLELVDHLKKIVEIDAKGFLKNDLNRFMKYT